MQALIAEYLGSTMFLFVTISTIASGCHLADVAASSGHSTTLQDGELLRMSQTVALHDVTSWAVVMCSDGQNGIMLNLFYVGAAYFGSCTVDSVTTLIIACSFGFTIFVTVYVTASFSGQCLLSIRHTCTALHTWCMHVTFACCTCLPRALCSPWRMCDAPASWAVSPLPRM